MPRRPRGVSRQQVDLIRYYSQRGYSANRIQRILQSRHIGMKRQILLRYVREFKGKPLKPSTEKYIPIKYRWIVVRGVQVAAYGSVNGVPRRVQFTGGAHELQQTAVLVYHHPPKARYQFLTISSRELLANPDKYLDFDEEWDKHPEIESL